jgi:putative heme-binding domain-containing protein
VFRARPDGTGIEPVFTAGMDNPVDVAFLPSGDRIVSGTFFQHPADGKRDGLIHAIYGGIYGKDHDPIHEPAHKWTAPTLMPVMTHLGPAAACGLHRYEHDAFGAEYRDNLFACQFNLRTVSRHVLIPEGSTYRTDDSRFVWSDDVDFHPTDVIEAADGSLLVVDTGGWYKLCCPSSQLVKADVPGGVYRVRKAGGHKVADPRGVEVDLSKLDGYAIADQLGDPRPAVQKKAADYIINLAREQPLYASTILLLTKVKAEGRSLPPPPAQRNAIWVAAKLSTPESRQFVRHSLLTDDDSVFCVAAHVLGLWRDRHEESNWGLTQGLDSKTLRRRRAAAEALGRIGDRKAVPDLLAALADNRNDRSLDHALTYALIEIGDAKATALGLTHTSPRVRRAVLAALQAIDPTYLPADIVLRGFTTDADPAVRETAWWVAGKHPDWGDKLVGHFRERLAQQRPTREQFEDLVTRLAAFGTNPAVQTLIAEFAAAEPGSTAADACRQAMARSGVRAVPAGWLESLVHPAGSGVPRMIEEVAAVVRSLPAPKAYPADLAAAFRKSAGNTDVPDKYRLLALAAIRPGLADVPDDLFALLAAAVRADRPGDERATAADVLARATLPPARLAAVAGLLPAAAPTERSRLVEAFVRAADESAGLALVAALRDPKVRPSVRAEVVKPILDKYPAAVKAEAAKLYAELDAARAGERERLEAIAKELPAGDVRRGQVVFNSQKAACVSCHKIGYVGGLVGPDLTRIGGVRTERDLLESIVYPSASFVRSYEPVRLTTKDGAVHQGILKRDAPDEVVLTVAADKEVRVRREDVEEIAPGSVSVMPAGLDAQISRQELADLIAFLRASK